MHHLAIAKWSSKKKKESKFITCDKFLLYNIIISYISVLK